MTAGQTTLQGNYIGLSLDGQTAAGNGSAGILVSSSLNTIGGTTGAARNVISGNAIGVHFDGTTAAGHVLFGNYIGTNATGTADVGNTEIGILIDSAADIQIGGRLQGQRNVISGNDVAGIKITGVSATDTTIEGNFIGTDRTAAYGIGNRDGIIIQSPGTTIGGVINAAANVISGNSNAGISIEGANAINIDVIGNFVGTDASGTTRVANSSGILLDADVSGITIGGDTPAQRNVISGNASGVTILGGGNFVQGNYIGTDVSGTAALGNGSGVTVAGSNNFVGTNADGLNDGSEGNLISGNTGNGVLITGSGNYVYRQLDRHRCCR